MGRIGSVGDRWWGPVKVDWASSKGELGFQGWIGVGGCGYGGSGLGYETI